MQPTDMQLHIGLPVIYNKMELMVSCPLNSYYKIIIEIFDSIQSLFMFYLVLEGLEFSLICGIFQYTYSCISQCDARKKNGEYGAWNISPF